MSIVDIKPGDCPIELRHKVEKVMEAEKKTWGEALLFLAQRVVSPSKRAYKLKAVPHSIILG